MSDKPRVYQGVRVKTTVKELLRRHRARQANSKKVTTIAQACLELQDLCASACPSRYVDPPTVSQPADASSSCGARALQLRAAAAASFPFPDSSSCHVQMQESAFHDIQQQFGDVVMFPGNGYSGNNNNSNNSSNIIIGGGGGGGGGGSYSAPLPPPPTLPLPWCHGLSSDADYYGPGTAACSSPEPLKFCNPVDPNSYSPQDSFSSSSSSSCYDSPTRMESSHHHGLTPEHFHYQHCNLQDCYCLPHCWPGQQETFSAPEYAPYYSPTDYAYACPVEENYFKRDFQMSSDMCYNVL